MNEYNEDILKAVCVKASICYILRMNIDCRNDCFEKWGDKD